MGEEAVSIGATTFQFFTRNPRGSKARAVNEKDVAAYLAFAKETEIGTVRGTCAIHLKSGFCGSESTRVCTG